VSDNVEVVTETEIRRRQADLLARFPNVVKFYPPDCCGSIYCGSNWADFSVEELDAIEQMTQWEWLAGGGSWDWLTASSPETTTRIRRRTLLGPQSYSTIIPRSTGRVTDHLRKGLPMQKIPTLFVRDEQDRRYVTERVTPGCEWVLAGEGVATRKYDGTCIMIDDADRWWTRRELRPGKPIPDGFLPVELDETTGKIVGWESAQQSGFAKWLLQAKLVADAENIELGPGTYELCGPKVNGNPEGYERHVLIPHAEADRIEILPHDLCFDGLRATVRGLHDHAGVEGIVWHHPDGRIAKLKARDFPRRP
jgi:hypothetical protein